MPPAVGVHEAIRWPLEWLQTRGLTLAKSASVSIKQIAPSQTTV
jgi:hypothetical protein